MAHPRRLLNHGWTLVFADIYYSNVAATGSEILSTESS
jgi:hypothetical protein